MKYYLKQFILPALLTLCITAGHHAAAQTVAIEQVEINDIDNATMSAVKWPFDIPFCISGPVAEDIESINFKYGIKDKGTREKNWITLPPTDLTGADGYITTPIKATISGKKFSLICPGLHPGIQYKFEFEVVRKISLDEKSVAAMRGALASHLKGFFASKIDVSITPPDLVTENAALTAIVQSYFPGKTLVEKANPTAAYPFSWDAFKFPSSNYAYTASVNLYNATTSMTSATGDMVTEFELMRDKLLADIEAIQSGSSKLNSYSKEALGITFTPGLEDFKAYTVLDGLKLLRQMCVRPSADLTGIFNGSRKISNGSIVGASEPDFQSILFVASLFRELNTGFIRDSALQIRHGKKELVETKRFGYFSPLFNTSVKEVIKYAGTIDYERSRLAKVEALLPDILANIVQFEAYEVEAFPEVDVLSEKTPYISAEAGIGYVHAFRALTHYQGANIYFAPVDKRARLRTFKGINYVLKALSFQIGVSSYFGDRPEKTRSIFGSGASTDLNLALGWRLNRILKVNAGIIPYKTNNTNELSDHYDLKCAGYFSIGLDVNLLKAFGDVAKLLNISN